MGDCFEVLNAGRKPKDVDWTAFKYSAFFGILPWLILWFEVGRIFYRYDIPLDVVPWWVWAFLVEYWLLFWSFPITLFAQYKQWWRYNNDKYPLLKNGGFIAGERTFIWLSFIAKTLLIWQAGIGAFSERRETTVADDYVR